MKKKIIIPTLMILAFASSCGKDHFCHCTSTTNTTDNKEVLLGDTLIIYEKSEKSGAKEACGKFTQEFAKKTGLKGYSSSSASCELIK